MINVFIPNVTFRKDRYNHILHEFKGKPEYNVSIVTPIFHLKSNISLWLTLQKIIRNQVGDEDFIIFCEDDHLFTKDYNYSFLRDCVDKSRNLNADILLGGVSWQKTALQVSNSLFWVEEFSGLQFSIIFKKFYQRILDAHFSELDSADYKLSSLTKKKFVIFPFISTQKEFGYSDITKHNQNCGRVNFLFNSSINIFSNLRTVNEYYFKQGEISFFNLKRDEEAIPTYFLPSNADDKRISKTDLQFKSQSEFELIDFDFKNFHEDSKFIEWYNFIKIIVNANTKDYDLIAIYNSSHVFSRDYNVEKFREYIFKSFIQRADVLVGGLTSYGLAVPIDRNRYWVDWFYGKTFLVIFKKFYNKLLNYHFESNDSIEGVISKLSKNKIALYPFISQNFELLNDKNSNTDTFRDMKLFNESCRRFSVIQNVYTSYVDLDINIK